MKKIFLLLIIIYVIPLISFSQTIYATRSNTGGGGLVGLKDSTDGDGGPPIIINKVGVNGIYFGDIKQNSLGGTVSRPLIYSTYNGSSQMQFSSINSRYNELVFLSYFDTSGTEYGDLPGDLSSRISMNIMWFPRNEDGTLIGEPAMLGYSQSIENDSSYAVINSVTGYKMKYLFDGRLQLGTPEGIKYALTDYGTLSGTITVKDGNGDNQTLTFTNGLLTSTTYTFAGVMQNNKSNLTINNYKDSPDYKEFLEFQKYLAMKKQFAELK